MSAAFLLIFYLRVVILTVMWMTWVTARPERPPANAAAWETESYASANRQFHLAMVFHVCWFLFALTMLVRAW